MSQHVIKPLYSSNHQEARKKVLFLYKMFLRNAAVFPTIFNGLPYTHKQYRYKIKEKFLENANVSDIRIIDVLIFKGRLTLDEFVYEFHTEDSVARFFQPTWDEKPTDFLNKFYQGRE
ncbi:NADH dehydrogenase [ubiquinone] 1 alpha subcomplex subunit 6 [Prorops nasuta]|uniref:NADH dehydrogenase [ubiquinone] 1 alpha subcomplex subunit 6 n=1 Tax=Prorops nasuta TaxID=863751 RepID=UPI0034CD3BDC